MIDVSSDDDTFILNISYPVSCHIVQHHIIYIKQRDSQSLYRYIYIFFISWSIFLRCAYPPSWVLFFFVVFVFVFVKRIYIRVYRVCRASQGLVKNILEKRDNILKHTNVYSALLHCTSKDHSL